MRETQGLLRCGSAGAPVVALAKTRRHARPPDDLSPLASHPHGADRAVHPFFRTLMKASGGIETRPICFIFFLPSFCFSRSLRLRVMSPP